MPTRPGAKTPINANTTGRFLSIEQVAAELNITTSQAYALLRSGSLPALKIGGRGQWRVERTRLEAWIEVTYAETETYVGEHPMAAGNVWRDEFGRPTHPGDPDVLDDPDVTSASHIESTLPNEG